MITSYQANRVLERLGLPYVGPGDEVDETLFLIIENLVERLERLEANMAGQADLGGLREEDRS